MRSETGSLEVICGPMFSGKTEELIKRLRRAEIAKKKVMIFKPRLDDRYSQDQIVSHSALRIPSQVIERAEEILARVHPDTEVIGIDEVQFLAGDVVGTCETLADAGCRVVVAGLDQDFTGAPFEPLPVLLAIADEVQKQHAICVVCGAPATRTQRLASSSLRVLVGAASAYEARCRAHHSPRPIEQLELPVGDR